MNKYPNSIRNNMVNTRPFRDEYNIQVTSLPEPQVSYKPQKEVNLKTIVIAVAIAAATISGAAVMSNIQFQNFQRATQTVYTEDVVNYPGIRFEISANGTGYFVDEQGRHFGQIDNLDAQQMANQYVENGIVNINNSHVK